MKHPVPGQKLCELETPQLLVDLNRFEANIHHLATYCRDRGKAWRPHCKANKSPAIARLLQARGATGITCAKLGEAELMVEQGIQSILLANQIVTPGKFAILAHLQREAEVIAAIDNLAIVKPMGTTAIAADAIIPVVVELDIGMGRVGIQPGAPALALAQAICAQPGLQFKGLMGYEGHVLDITPPKAKEHACHAALDLLVQTRDLLIENGLEVEIVSAGGTGSYELCARHDGISELQAGGGIFMDAMYRRTCHVESLQPALTVLATVTSRAADRVVLDAGFKTLSAYHHPPEVLHREDLSFRYLSAEHGVFDIAPDCAGPALGQQVELLVGYSDSTTFLHDFFVGIRDGLVAEIWEISARGLVR
ncbi:MAG: DSD1 family PLP-dependent enzyme [Candidatus Latescibacterota bacterium]|nr:DSD1 family PLP-dependent enzyme [Candidatus Latescibacterota bacterium]